METKSLLYIVIGTVLIVFLLQVKEVAIEFIKSTVEPVPQMQFPGMFMLPNQDRQNPSFFGKDFAERGA